METTINERIKIMNPINGTTVYEMDSPTDAELQSVFQKAKDIQPKIQALSISDRIKEVQKIRDYVIQYESLILDSIIAETGKARTDAFAAEVFEVTDVIDVYTKLAPKF